MIHHSERCTRFARSSSCLAFQEQKKKKRKTNKQTNTEKKNEETCIFILSSPPSVFFLLLFGYVGCSYPTNILIVMLFQESGR